MCPQQNACGGIEPTTACLKKYMFIPLDYPEKHMNYRQLETFFSLCLKFKHEMLRSSLYSS